MNYESRKINTEQEGFPLLSTFNFSRFAGSRGARQLGTRPARGGRGGYAMLTSVIFFLFASGIVVFSVASSGLSEVKIGSDLMHAKESYFLSEAGMEDVVYRIKNGVSVSNVETISLNGYQASTTVSDVSGAKEVTAIGNRGGYYRKNKTTLINGDGMVFHYGVQSGEGGVNFANSSSVKGNLYSNGPITGAGNYVYGDIVSAGPTGLINNVHATGSAYAHTIQSSIVDKNAYYQAISGTTVSGASYPGSADQATSSLPISDSKISEWESDALAGGGEYSSPCPYNITGSITLGPKKINCDLNISISNNAQITLNGPVWVSGNISISNPHTNIRVNPSLGNVSIAMIADNPSNRTTSSKVDIANDVEFFGSGGNTSYVLLISQNNSAEQGGSNLAIDLRNSASGNLLLYAGHGEISMGQSSNLKEITAYKISLANSAEVNYETGLASLIFSAGPGGGYSISSWKETE